MLRLDPSAFLYSMLIPLKNPHFSNFAQTHFSWTVSLKLKLESAKLSYDGE